MLSFALVTLLPAAVLASVFTTSPVGSTTFTAGQPASVTWMNGEGGPSLEEFGDAKISIFVGNALQQTPLQVIAPSVNVATTNSVDFVPDASIGPNGNEYFIRFESLNLKDSGAPQFPALAFSAKYTMAGMSGEFNSTVQQQIDGQATAPIAQPTPAAGSPSSAPSASAGASSARPSSSSASRTASGTTVSATTTPNAATSVSVSAKFIGAAFALFGLVLL